MAKKSRKNRRNDHKDNVVNPFFDEQGGPRKSDWHPLDDQIDGRRDKKYVKNIKPRSAGQAKLMQAIDEYNLSLAVGPAGTGKTYLAISKAVEALENGKIERIVLSRPCYGSRRINRLPTRRSG